MTRNVTLLLALLITTNGIAQTKVNKIDEFNKIVTTGGANLQIHYSDTCSLQVSDNNACGESVDVSVSSKTLYIEVENSNSNPCEVEIRIGVPFLSELKQHGGGNIVLEEGFKPVNSLRCVIEGGGNMDVSAMPVNSVYASIEGGGNIVLNAEKELEGKISGGGVIEYVGDPKVKSDVSEGGIIRKK